MLQDNRNTKDNLYLVGLEHNEGGKRRTWRVHNLHKRGTFLWTQHQQEATLLLTRFTCDLRIRMSADTLSCSSDSRFLSIAGEQTRTSIDFFSLIHFILHLIDKLCVVVRSRLTLQFVSCIVGHLLYVIGDCLQVILCLWGKTSGNKVLMDYNVALRNKIVLIQFHSQNVKNNAA